MYTWHITFGIQLLPESPACAEQQSDSKLRTDHEYFFNLCDIKNGVLYVVRTHIHCCV